MITITPVDESYIRLTGDEDELYSIWKNYSFYVPGFMFMPQYKAGMFDGQIHLLNMSTHKMPKGLLQNVLNWTKTMGIDVDNQCQMSKTEIDIEKFISKYQFYSGGKQITPREDQLFAIKRAIKMEQCTNVCPTSFGKSLCIFAQCLYHIEHNRKILLIVPTIDLVRQFKSDIKDYCNTGSEMTEWYPNLHEIYAGKSKDISDITNIVISTWQSIYKMDAEWINQFDVIILDEAHKGKAKELSGIFDRATSVHYRTGWTGSLKKASINSLVVEGIFGPIHEVTTTRDLMDAGIVANLTVNIIKFIYPEAIKKSLNGVPYDKELQYIETVPERMHTICKLIGVYKKTGLILFRKIKHGKDFYKTLREMYPDRNVYLVYGNNVIKNDVKYHTFEELKSGVELEENAILVCSYGVFSTGISIKNLHYIVFGAPLKSFVQTVQSIGRGLRVSATKHKVALIDIVDDMCYKPKSAIKRNYMFKHFEERFSIYCEQRFNYKIMNVPLNVATRDIA